MVEDTLDKYTAMADELRGLKEVKFFAAIKMDDITDRWSLVFGLIGAKNLDKRKKVFDTIRKIIVANLDKEEMQNVARIGLFSTTDHLVKDLKRFPENELISKVKANGNFIHEGYVLISSNSQVTNE
jgi:hypothetical protein